MSGVVTENIDKKGKMSGVQRARKAKIEPQMDESNDDEVVHSSVDIVDESHGVA